MVCKILKNKLVFFFLKTLKIYIFIITKLRSFTKERNSNIERSDHVKYVEFSADLKKKLIQIIFSVSSFYRIIEKKKKKTKCLIND